MKVSEMNFFFRKWTGKTSWASEVPNRNKILINEKFLTHLCNSGSHQLQIHAFQKRLYLLEKKNEKFWIPKILIWARINLNGSNSNQLHLGHVRGHPYSLFGLYCWPLYSFKRFRTISGPFVFDHNYFYVIWLLWRFSIYVIFWFNNSQCYSTVRLLWKFIPFWHLKWNCWPTVCPPSQIIGKTINWPHFSHLAFFCHLNLISSGSVWLSHPPLTSPRLFRSYRIVICTLRFVTIQCSST